MLNRWGVTSKRNSYIHLLDRVYLSNDEARIHFRKVEQQLKSLSFVAIASSIFQLQISPMLIFINLSSPFPSLNLAETQILYFFLLLRLAESWDFRKYLTLEGNCIYTCSSWRDVTSREISFDKITEIFSVPSN